MSSTPRKGTCCRYVPADSLVALVTVNAFRTRVPGGNLSVHIQQEERIVLHPGRNPVTRGVFVRLGGLSLVTQQQEVADCTTGIVYDDPAQALVAGRESGMGIEPNAI
jgi:hypothetical protein